MYVCICNAVTDCQIRKAAHRGLSTLEALSAELRVATCCGRCADSARQILNQALDEQSGAPPVPVLALTSA